MSTVLLASQSKSALDEPVRDSDLPCSFSGTDPVLPRVKKGIGHNTDLIRYFPTLINTAATLKNKERGYALGYEYIRKASIFSISLQKRYHLSSTPCPNQAVITKDCDTVERARISKTLIPFTSYYFFKTTIMMFLRCWKNDK